jgi:hypothetical protein
MKRIALTLSLVAALTSPLRGAETLQRFSWSEVQRQGTLPQGKVLPATDEAPYERLEVGSAGGAATIEVLSVESPGIAQATYAIRGQVRCRNVRGNGYLEMWSHMPGGDKFFSRTTAASGPMACLSGDCERRAFVVPAYLDDRSDRPVRLTLSVVLPGPGTVELDSLELVEFGPGEDPLTASQGGWWSRRDGGVIGAVIGASLGLIGAVVGVMGSRRTLHRAALGVMGVVAAAGVVMVMVGIAALAMKQPYAVWYPLVLGGIIGAAVFGGLIPVVRRRRQQDEMRRIQAMDAS